jgi:hypothetical protein
MVRNSVHRNSINPACKLVLYGSLVVSGATLIGSILWVYYRVHYGLGPAVAEVAVALMSILILVLIGAGIRAGSQMDRFICQGDLEDWTIYQSSQPVRNLVSWLGYEEAQLVVQEAPTVVNKEKEELSTGAVQEAEEILALIDKPKKRGGRHPTHPLDKWTRVVVAWEKLDKDRYPITLNEFLCEHFGRNADGSPGMSENSFYENKKRVLAELRRQAAKKEFSAN